MQKKPESVEEVISTYRTQYGHWSEIDECIKKALKIYKDHTPKEIREMWRNEGLHTVTRNLATDLHNLFVHQNQTPSD